MIHGKHKTSDRYSLAYLKRLIEKIDPDYVITEIPPDRLADAATGFANDGVVTEERVARFPEYVDVLFPLTKTLDFKIIPAAAWTAPMADYRRDALKRIENDPTRAKDWRDYRAALEAMNQAIGDASDDPMFIHSAEYDEITKQGLGPYATLFAEDLGRGDWESINKAHYALISAALDHHQYEHARILIMFGAGHKYWFLGQLNLRNDINLIDPEDATVEDGASAWKLDAYFEDTPDMEAIKALLADHGGLGDGVVEELPDIDWVAHALEGLGVVRCGRFVLYGVHDADKLPNEEGDIPIRIDANQAFGTGHHPTTAGCLTLLDRFAGWAPKSIFDLGCGSAVLAIAAAKLWDRHILASDIDEKSVEIAIENAAHNNVASKVTALAAAGFDHPDIAAAAPFDFVFANILAGPLAELAPAMADHIVKNGRVMLAGLMAEQETKVTAAYEAAGFRQINRLDHETWPVLLFVKT
ncbi:Ribosomal protein L11 methyltransferase (L11 Mtase) [Durusdinium trenchii]|uniref:ETFB lysine methyltransferase n=1 Tax=Durusdinium trenchii TaxID=1381693 RepID=A0ABP0LSD6_9DINO